MGFPFLFAICTAAMIAIAFVDIEKGRRDARAFTEKRKVDRVVAETGLSADAILNGKIVDEAVATGNDSRSTEVQ
jgi:hypothetical protein